MIGCYHLETVECDNCRRCPNCGTIGRHRCEKATAKPQIIPGFSTERALDFLKEPPLPVSNPEPEPVVSPAGKAFSTIIAALESLDDDDRERVWSAVKAFFYLT